MEKIKGNPTAQSLLEDVLQIINKQAAISLIEHDLALDKLRQAYDLIYFDKLQIISKSEIDPPIKHEKIEDLPGPTEIEEEIQLSETENDEIAKEELIPEIEFIIEDKAAEDEPKEAVEEEMKEPLGGEVLPAADPTELFDEDEEPQFSESEDGKIESSLDLFSTVTEKDRKDTLVDALSREMPKETLVDQFQKNKIKLLKEAIGINEKFFFLNELFDGDLTRYNKAIDSLDQFSNKDEAGTFIESLSNEYQWNDHEQASEQFLEFVNRKFSEA